MQYMGGKARIAKALSEAMLSLTPNRSTYLEPFVGGGWMFEKMAPNFVSANCGDVQPDIVLMWQAVAEGWVPPDEMSKERWIELKSESPSPDRAFAGFGCSFGGKWFGGYARPTRPGRNYAGAASRNIERKRDAFRRAHIMERSYDQWAWLAELGAVVYCDPPYAGTTAYNGTGAWDASQFWADMDQWSLTSTVFVSEYAAPPSWECVWEKQVQAALKRTDKSQMVTERLFMKGPQ